MDVNPSGRRSIFSCWPAPDGGAPRCGRASGGGERRGEVGNRKTWRRFRVNLKGWDWMRACSAAAGEGHGDGATVKKIQPARPGCHLSAPWGVRSKPKCKLRGALMAGIGLPTAAHLGEARGRSLSMAYRIPKGIRGFRRMESLGRLHVPARHPFPKAPVQGK